MRLSERIKQNTAESVFRIWEGSVAGVWRLNGLVTLSLDWWKCRESNGGRDLGRQPGLSKGERHLAPFLAVHKNNNSCHLW